LIEVSDRGSAETSIRLSATSDGWADFTKEEVGFVNDIFNAGIRCHEKKFAF
jgi:hypothetical protein